MKDKRAARGREVPFACSPFSIVSSASRTTLSSLCVIQTIYGFGDLTILSSRIRHGPDTVGHSHPPETSLRITATVWAKIDTRGNEMAISTDWFGLTPQSDNHSDSGKLVHVAKRTV